jgi:hypothetical protein
MPVAGSFIGMTDAFLGMSVTVVVTSESGGDGATAVNARRAPCLNSRLSRSAPYEQRKFCD